jgi:hypothetical protein
MRLIVALTLAVATVAAPVVGTSSAAAPDAELLGVWTGQWTAGNGARGGAVEMIVAREPGDTTVVAQMTFVDGALSDTVRREGRLTREGLYFDLLGGGTLVLTRESNRRLTGEFAGGPDMPARFGSLELTRRT